VNRSKLITLNKYLSNKSSLLSQAIAIQQSLCLDPSEELNVFNFIDELINKMDKIEDDARYILYCDTYCYI